MDHDELHESSKRVSAAPTGTKCRATLCTTQVNADKLYCHYHWATLPAALKNKLVDNFDIKQPLKYQPQIFLQARVEADKSLNMNDSLLKSQADQKKTK